MLDHPTINFYLTTPRSGSLYEKGLSILPCFGELLSVVVVPDLFSSFLRLCDPRRSVSLRLLSVNMPHANLSGEAKLPSFLKTTHLLKR